MTVLVAVQREGQLALASCHGVYMSGAPVAIRNLAMNKVSPAGDRAYIGWAGGSSFKLMWEEYNEKDQQVDFSSPRAALHTVRDFRLWCEEQDERYKGIEPRDHPGMVVIDSTGGLIRPTWDGDANEHALYLTAGAAAACWAADGAVEALLANTALSASWIACEAVRTASRTSADSVLLNGHPSCEVLMMEE